MTSILFFIIKIGTVLSEIVLVPSNTVVMEGRKMSMDCLMTNDFVIRKWSFRSSSRVFPAIYIHETNRFHEEFQHFGVKIKTNGPAGIYANFTRSSDAGIYTCYSERGGKEGKYSAHLIVLESLPVCESNLTRNNSHSLNDGDKIWMQCSINFRGFWAPSMEWIQHGGDIGLEGKTIRDGIETMLSFSQSVTSKFTIAVNSSTNGSFYSCKIYFANYSNAEMTTANNAPSFTNAWNSTAIYSSHSSTQSISSISDAGWSSAVTSSTSEKSFSVNWYLVSLSLVAALSLFFIVVVAVAVGRCIRFKKKMSDHYASATKEAIEMPTQESAYDMIPYATSDNYETIGEEEDTDPSVEPSSQPHVGALPTPGYSALLPVKPCPPAIYSRMESYETPADIVPYSNLTNVKVAIEIIPGKQIGELDHRKSESPPKESLLNTHTYLEVKV